MNGSPESTVAAILTWSLGILRVSKTNEDEDQGPHFPARKAQNYNITCLITSHLLHHHEPYSGLPYSLYIVLGLYEKETYPQCNKFLRVGVWKQPSMVCRKNIDTMHLQCTDGNVIHRGSISHGSKQSGTVGRGQHADELPSKLFTW
jgi:hypothetical protein